MEKGDQIVACFGVAMKDGQKVIGVYGVGEYIGKQMPVDELHHRHPDERNDNPRFEQPMIKIEDETLTDWQSAFYTMEEFDEMVAKNPSLPIVQFPIPRPDLSKRK